MTEQNQPQPPPTAPIRHDAAPPANAPIPHDATPPAIAPIPHDGTPPATEGTGSPMPPADDPTAPDRTVPERTTPAPGFDARGRVKATRVSGVWVGLIGTAVFLILLVIFIAQNSRQVSLHFFGWHGRFSLALTILISAVIGVLLVAIPGTVRIIQLRRALRRNGPRPR